MKSKNCKIQIETRVSLQPRSNRLSFCLSLCTFHFAFLIASGTFADDPAEQAWLTTRPDTRAYGRIDGRSREREPQAIAAIWRELDLHAGDAIVDIGCGGGWWLQEMADRVGSDGTVYGLEIKRNLVEEVKRKFADTPQVKTILGMPDRTGLPEKSCDVGFMVKVYHHIDKNHRVAYLRNLRSTIKPDGRLVIVERHPIIPSRRKQSEPVHSMAPSQLMSDMLEAGWLPSRFELLPKSAYYVAVFVQMDVFKFNSPN